MSTSNEPSQLNGQINSVVGSVEQIAGKVIEAGVSPRPSSIFSSFYYPTNCDSFRVSRDLSSRPSEVRPSLAS